MTEVSRLYRPEEIATFLRTDALVLNGVSPEIHQQNLHLVQQLGELGCSLGVEPISIQLLGSRSNGTAQLDSDVDFAFLAFGDEKYPQIDEFGKALAEKTGLSCDPSMARVCLGITSRIPDTPEGLAFWAESTAPFSLFNKGIAKAPSPTATLLQAATTSLQMQSGKQERDSLWRGMQEEYNAAYLGKRARILEKLHERLDPAHYLAVARLINESLMRQRYKAFGLPRNIEQAHGILEYSVRDLPRTNLSPTAQQAFDLYSDTQRTIAA